MRLPRPLGEYLLLERLGSGGMGTVYRAELAGPHGFRLPVAVKVLHRAGAEVELARALADEARLLSRLTHPNVVAVQKLLEVPEGIEGVTLAMVLGLVTGVTFHDLVSARTVGGWRPTPEQILHLLMQAADALGAAHAL